ncbi:maleylpyruvate isomerase N-terminal domain-containing protein [Pseudonocardia sp. TRM90224]|uniref:maleylpyruvate isomerase N-terminal domain-containing protein n=1 Tax=Pseudonocardia sp. TRM90224 TaxID=2812678 RepID=UPI001E37B576|nr:maleylpyruvate isomerase N-terminal domain-containing protein [Pseudonocardia sp. TRM90224]
MALSVDHAIARAALLGELDRFVEVVAALSDHELLAASRCHGWAVLDVVVHVRTGLQEMVGGVVAAIDRAPDRDAATYWSIELPSTDGSADEVDRILWTRRTASAYRRPAGALEHLRIAADAVRTSVARMPEGSVSFQGHVLAGGDFLATWAVELAVHHLDLGRDLDVPAPTPESLALGRATVEALAGSPLPDAWTDEDCLLIGSGRTTPRDPGGQLAQRMPVLG